MLNFNDKNIITGYIKQLLYEFNLPTCKIFNSEEECNEYFKKDPQPLEINKSNSVVVIIKNWKENNDYFIAVDINTLEKREMYRYRYNHSYLNLTKNMKIENLIYDSHVHKYLGEYLRFIRDYMGINLMSLYNCYSNEFEIINDYKYYIIPVKYKTDYTLFYKNKSKNPLSYIYTTNKENLNDQFNSNKSNTKLNKKEKNLILLTSPVWDSNKEFFKEKDLNLVIKIPLTDEFPILVLEGNYNNYENHIDLFNIQSSNLRANNNIKINFEKNKDNNYKYLYEKEYSNIFNNNIQAYNFQLVNMIEKDNYYSYPIADRLIEYLIGNVITNKDKISKNIIDAKYKLDYRYLTHNKLDAVKKSSSFNIMDRFKMLDTLNINKKLKINKEDLLGYVDKDIESILDDERWELGREK